MPARESAEAREGLALIDQGVPLREAARRVGVAPSTLVRARARRDLPALPRRGGPKPAST